MAPALVSFLLLFIACLFGKEPTAVYLTWETDPTSTIAISWITAEEDDPSPLFLYREGNWETIESSSQSLGEYSVHRASIEKLSSDTEYSFRFGLSQSGEQAISYTFRTAPQNLERPLKFVIGGDLYLSTKLFRKMNQSIAREDPLFAVVGGDIAYAIKTNPLRISEGTLKRWIAFLQEWSHQMRGHKGRLIPLLVTSGNHDVATDDYELFFSLFPLPQKRFYRAIDFKNYLSLILLDTGHFQPIQGQQSYWLGKTLRARSEFPYLFAIYHEAAYPSYYSYEGAIPKKIRTYWCPLFEQWGVQLAFENHNHAFKRTHPIKEGKIDPKGVIYLGDGCWGAPARKPKEHWYLEKKAKKNNVYLVELRSKKAQIKAIDLLGETLDEIEIAPKGAD